MIGMGRDALLIIFSLYKPVRTLMVTYHHASGTASVASEPTSNG